MMNKKKADNDEVIREAFEKAFIIKDYCVFNGVRYIDRPPFRFTGCKARADHVMAVNNAYIGYKSAQAEHEKQIEDLQSELKIFSDQYQRYLDLNSDQSIQIESMKCCGNCKKYHNSKLDHDCMFCARHPNAPSIDIQPDNWKSKEQE
jgi:hypothetical protein